MAQPLQSQYSELLFQYLNNKGEAPLYEAQFVSKEFIQEQILPEEALLMHLQAMQEKYDLPRVWKDSFQFFLEFLVQYGLTYRERDTLLAKQQQIEAELSLAATVQHSLLPDHHHSSIPSGIDIGVKTVASRKVSGDFYNINPYEHGVDIAVADVSGKSIPAAILMAMIKFAMDGMLEDGSRPHVMLEKLNRFIYKNSEPSRFVTMFWGNYHALTKRFLYANAGHEAALFYRSREDRFMELKTEGCALGISTRYGYETKSIDMDPGDFVLLYTDGLIETRNSDVVDDSQFLQHLLRQMDRKESAQDIVEKLFQQILAKNEMEIADDQTLLLLKRLK
ncbi:PP2C family protein-serine/threonine phosphatase [Ammoniphilus sp. CFH 90114]|uniref:SpoIIE family protein phosphatase n=1 Tax=Ammoniphilus sp. CFH 90114 TaxID=2493665 RepID=UPI00100E6F4C|nr:PP2C family protein-serine/threonine phosphatase [Ammoniphilus sp. CFH 90114]RXT15455.1 phosphoserine phosphatase [Ammoniphilus sp. CFH 90114]